MQTTHGIFLFTDDGKQVLIVHPTNHDERFRSIPKGLGEEGESSLESAFRELEEETTLNLRESFIKGEFELYVDLGISKYRNKDKQLHAHLLMLNLEQSIKLTGLDLYCPSTFIDKTLGEEFPENDEVVWLPYELLRFYDLHHAQKDFLKKINRYLELKEKSDTFDMNKLKTTHGK